MGRFRVNRKLGTLKNPSGVTFSSRFAYIHHGGDAHVSLIQLSGLAKPGPPPVADVPVGAEPPETVPGIPGVSLVAVTPEDGGAMIGNPADRVVYLYREAGMLAPSNSFKTYTAAPLGLFIYDHSLIERMHGGEYTSTVHLERGGVYDVYFLLSSPRVAVCFEMQVEGSPWEKQVEMQDSWVLKNLTDEKDLEPGRPAKIRFRLKKEKSEKPAPALKDVRVLGMHFYGGWQTRKWAKAVGDGIFETEMVCPKNGEYRILVSSPTLGIKFGNLRHSYVVRGEKALTKRVR